ncbi:hypothetical protein L9F63_008802, partial [Diploptera punctata]
RRIETQAKNVASKLLLFNYIELLFFHGFSENIRHGKDKTLSKSMPMVTLKKSRELRLYKKKRQENPILVIIRYGSQLECNFMPSSKAKKIPLSSSALR